MAAAIVKVMFFAKNMTLDTFLLKKIHSFTPAFQKGNERKVHI
jgi:predicted N-formylglutamate amidohydrolase